MALQAKDTTPYITVLGSHGDFRQSVPQETEGAKLREYETSDGKKGSKYELAFKSISGFITGIDFKEGDFGKNLVLTFSFPEEDQEDVKVSLGCGTPYGEDVLKKLPNVNLDEAVVFAPYSFTGDDGRDKRGMSIYQGDEKIQSFYYDVEKKKSLHGIPEPEGDTAKFDSDDWKAHFIKVRKFLVTNLEKEVLPKIQAKASVEEVAEK